MNDDDYAVINIFGFCFCVLAIVFLVLLFTGLIFGIWACLFFNPIYDKFMLTTAIGYVTSVVVASVIID